MKVRMVKVSGCSEFWEGAGTLTDEHPASSYGQPVFVPDEPARLCGYANGARWERTADVLGPAEIGPGYLHRLTGETYTPAQEAWIDTLIIAAHTDREPGAYDRHFHFGSTWKNARQLAAIEEKNGERLALNG